MRPNGIDSEPRLCGSALRLAAAPLLQDLWSPDRARLKALLDLSIARDIKLSDCLEALFPDKESKSALAHFRSFRKRINDAAARRGIALQCDLDQKRRSAPGDRRCWFSGANPAAIETATVAGASIDVLNFIGLLLGGELRGARALPTAQGTDAPIERLNQLLGSNDLPAATLAFRYWLHAIAHGLPEPAPRHVNLAGADLEGWTIRGRSSDQPLRLRGANLEGARLSRTRLENVDLTTANLKHVAAREAVFANVAATHADLTRSDLRDLKWRIGSLAEARLSDARISGTQWIDVDLAGASLPDNWEHDAAFLDRARMETRPIVPQHATELAAVPASAAQVTAYAFSPDGRFVVSGANDGTLRVWNAETAACLRMLTGHTSPVKTCGFSPDGRQIVSVSRAGIQKVWDSDSGECLGTQPRHAEVATDNTVSPIGRRIASLSDDASLAVCDAATGTSLWTGHHFPDGETAALDPAHNRILWASAEAWRHLGWRWLDPATGRPRLLPAEFFGPLPRGAGF